MSCEAGEVGGGERHRKKGIDNREWVPTAWVIDARTIPVVKHWSAALIPHNRLKAACGVEAMLCELCTTECLKYW